jgi:putative aldouronate transport system permease protein
MSIFTKQTKLGRSYSDKIFDGIVFIILTLIFILVAYPLYFVIISSISSPSAVAGGKVVWLPIGFNWDGYKAVFEEKSVMRGFANSLMYTFVGTCINLVVTLPTSYALSRDDFYGKKAITIFYMITMFVSGGLIPTYLVVQGCGFIDKIWALVIPGAISVYNMIIARTFFKSNLPTELLEAAKLDGCGNTKFFFHVALPLSGAIIAILVLYYGIGHWNSYFSALLYITSPEKFPLQLVLRTILVQNVMRLQIGNLSREALAEVERKRQVAELMKYSLIIISSIPVMVLYPFVQKYFVKGVMIGSIKG